MPPAVRITREMIIDAAYNLVSTRGVEALNARELAKCAGCSTQPIFTTCGSMDEVVAEVRVKAMEALHKMESRFEGEDNTLFRLAYVYIGFAQEQPKLFQLLFLSSTENAMREEMFSDDVQKQVMNESGLERAFAESLCANFFCYIHGIAVCEAQTKAEDPNLGGVIPENNLKQSLKDFYKAYRKLYKKKADN